MRAPIVATLTAAALLAAPAANAASPPAGATDMGGINLTAYCQSVYGANYRSTVIGSTALDWFCVPVIHHVGATTYFPLTPDSMNAACLFMYRLPGVYAVALSNAPTSWECYRGSGHRIHQG